jgi:hypothetical protein
MALGNQVKTEPLSTTYTYEAYPVGTLYVEPADEVVANGSGVSTTTSYPLLKGDRTWIFIKAGAAIPAGACLKRSSSTDPFVGAENDADGMTPKLLLGVADHAISNTYYGWVIAQGCCVVECSAGVTAGHNLDTDGSTGNAGSVDTSAGVTASGNLGIALENLSATTTGFAQAYISVL